MSDINKTIDDIFDESFDSTGHLRRLDVVDNALKAWRDGQLTLDPDHVRRADIVNEALQAWRDSPSEVRRLVEQEVNHSVNPLTEQELERRVKCSMEQAVDRKILALIEKDVDDILKECEATPEDIKYMQWYLSGTTV